MTPAVVNKHRINTALSALGPLESRVRSHASRRSLTPKEAQPPDIRVGNLLCSQQRTHPIILLIGGNLSWFAASGMHPGADSKQCQLEEKATDADECLFKQTN